MSTALHREDEESPLDRLTEKERTFVGYYVGPARCSGAAAARMMGYKEHGSDRAVASRFLANANVRDAVEYLLAEYVRMSAGECLGRLAAIARCDPRQYFSLRHAHDCPGGDACRCDPEPYVDPNREADWSLVQRIGKDRKGDWTIETPSKVESLALIARSHALLTDRVQQDGEVVYRLTHTRPRLEEEPPAYDASPLPPSECPQDARRGDSDEDRPPLVSGEPPSPSALPTEGDRG